MHPETARISTTHPAQLCLIMAITPDTATTRTSLDNGLASPSDVRPAGDCGAFARGAL